MANIWNPETHEYTPYELPEGASTYEEDMNKIVACCSCGKPIKFGKCFTSQHIHSDIGIGYAECEGCYTKYSNYERSLYKNKKGNNNDETDC